MKNGHKAKVVNLNVVNYEHNMLQEITNEKDYYVNRANKSSLTTWSHVFVESGESVQHLCFGRGKAKHRQKGFSMGCRGAWGAGERGSVNSCFLGLGNTLIFFAVFDSSIICVLAVACVAFLDDAIVGVMVLSNFIATFPCGTK